MNTLFQQSAFTSQQILNIPTVKDLQTSCYLCVFIILLFVLLDDSDNVEEESEEGESNSGEEDEEGHLDGEDEEEEEEEEGNEEEDGRSGIEYAIYVIKDGGLLFVLLFLLNYHLVNLCSTAVSD